MLCDKADCNFYDSNMEYNCAWGNDGSSSIMCMTHNYKKYSQRPLTSKSGYVKGVNYKQLYESEKHLRELAESRFRAGEKFAYKCRWCNAVSCRVSICEHEREYQQAIKDYEKAGK